MERGISKGIEGTEGEAWAPESGCLRGKDRGGGESDEAKGTIVELVPETDPNGSKEEK